jgi:hypothetical protein
LPTFIKVFKETPNMNEKVEKFINDLELLNSQLHEMREYFWLNIDRTNETDRQRGILFDNKFEKIKDQFLQNKKTVGNFLEKSFFDPKKEARNEALNKLYSEFANFDEWDEIAKNALIEKYTNDILKINTGTKVVSGERSPKANNTKLLVTFNDGTKICETTSAKTFAETIRKIGIEKIIELNIIVDKAPFVSRDKEMRGRIALDDGYYVNSHSSTFAKKRLLEDISQRLNIGLKIEIIGK